MANILLLDDNPVAQKAMSGVLGRADHRLAVAGTIEEAWKMLVRNVAVDLLVMEVKLVAEGQPLNLLKLLRSHPFFKELPVLVYTGVTAREAVQLALSLHVQNYLIKPYSDEKLLAEVNRAEAKAWRGTLFDDPRSFCAQMELSMEELQEMFKRAQRLLGLLTPHLDEIVKQQRVDPCAETIADLLKLTEECGYWGLYDVLQVLVNAAQEKDWLRAQTAISAVGIADKLIEYHLNPETVPPDFVTEDEIAAAEENRRRALWLGPDVLDRCPIVDWDNVCQGLAGLSGFPVVQSSAASFEMSADGRESSVQPLSDIAAKDPGLAAQVIQQVNTLQDDVEEYVGDPQQAVQMLGGSRLRVLSKDLPVVPDSAFHFPGVSWQQFWIYQFGCARLCAFICEFMEVPVFMPHAYWAGLLHDIGKLALNYLYPDCLRAASKIAAETGVKLDDAMRTLIGGTSADAGAYLAERCSFPATYTNVIRNCGHPDIQQPDGELVALVTFASQLCLRYRLGSNGEPPAEIHCPMEEIPGWSILRNRVFPSFDLERFESVVQDWVDDQRAVLTGKADIVVD